MTPLTNGDQKTISVSRDALRADLAELQLGMQTWLLDELEKKASATDLDILRSEIALAAKALNENKESAAKALNENKDRAASALADQLAAAETVNTVRFQKIEQLQSRLVGGLILAAVVLPAVSALVTRALS